MQTLVWFASDVKTIVQNHHGIEMLLMKYELAKIKCSVSSDSKLIDVYLYG